MTQQTNTNPISKAAPLVVYFDGSCPLCATEIAYYRRQDMAGAVCFLDASREGASVGPDLTQRQAMQRFHVRTAEGTVLSGAAAFVSLWGKLPRWRWAARLAARPGVMALLEVGYRGFLHIRPGVSKLARRLQRSG